MYTAFYNLRGLPIQLTRDHRFFFDSRPHRKAAAYLSYGLSKGEGFIVITGEIGAGKTTLVNYILSEIQGPGRVAAKIVTTQLEAENFLRIVASAFGLPQRGSDKATILEEIESFLIESHRVGRRPLLFVDEVQNLPHSSLEELRMLSNFQIDENSLLQIFLIGQPQFKKTLASKSLSQLRERVITAYHLQPLDAEETHKYIEHRLGQVGWAGDPSFSDESLLMIYQETGGVPRRINLLCDRLLLFGYVEQTHRIDSTVVQEVLMDMNAEGLPAPGIATSNSRAKTFRTRRSSSRKTLSQRIKALEQELKIQEERLETVLTRTDDRDSSNRDSKVEN